MTLNLIGIVENCIYAFVRKRRSLDNLNSYSKKELMKIISDFSHEYLEKLGLKGNEFKIK